MVEVAVSTIRNGNKLFVRALYISYYNSERMVIGPRGHHFSTPLCLFLCSSDEEETTKEFNSRFNSNDRS